MVAFNQFQYQDLQQRSEDLYANTKYSIILDYLKGQPSLDILNVGCGSGELSLLLAKQGHQVLGIDPVPEYVQLAVENAEHADTRACRYEVSTIEDFDADRQFDCLVSTDVLEHIEDDRTAFHRMAELVRPGGLIVITVPAGQWLFGHHDEVLGHYRRYSMRSLCQLVRDHCQVQKVRYFGFSLIPVCYLYSKVWRIDYPVAAAGDSGKSPLVSRVLRALLQLDRTVPMPLGTSLILMGRRTA